MTKVISFMCGFLLLPYIGLNFWLMFLLGDLMGIKETYFGPGVFAFIAVAVLSISIFWVWSKP